MNGVLVIDKPAGITSHDVVARLRRALRTKKIGHTGTLDPFATGVLVMLVGPATRLAQYLDRDEKEYLADVRFGISTDTGDRTGTVINAGGSVPTEKELTDVLRQFIGNIQQTPPMYSAKKVGGKKLYELARRGETIERAAVEITVKDLEIADVSPDGTFRLRTVCSAGTYVRTLAEDIASRLGTFAHLAELRRIRAGAYTLEQAAELGDGSRLAAKIQPPAEAVAHMETFVLNEERSAKTRNGLSTRSFSDTADGQLFRMVDEQGELVAVGVYDAAEKAIKPKIVLV